jgi:hypothetical protein
MVWIVFPRPTQAAGADQHMRARLGGRRCMYGSLSRLWRLLARRPRALHSMCAHSVVLLRGERSTCGGCAGQLSQCRCRAG